MDSAKKTYGAKASSALVEAIGLIKHISPLRKKPGGKIRVLFPINARGLEVEFLLHDIAIPNKDRIKLEGGMTMQFSIKGDSSNGFTAHKIKPVEYPEYYGSVIKAPSRDGSTESAVVSLDLTLDPVLVSAESIRNLKLSRPLAVGDYALVRIHWDKWIEALHDKRRPEWEIVQLIEKTKNRPRRSRSHSRETKIARPLARDDLANVAFSSDELSPQHERETRPNEPCQNKYRRRSRSIGIATTSAYDDDGAPRRFYPYMQPAGMESYHYAQFTPDMLYASMANMYGPGPMWMSSNMIPSYGPRSVQHG